jgi:hypothetical protein
MPNAPGIGIERWYIWLLEVGWSVSIWDLVGVTCNGEE